LSRQKGYYLATPRHSGDFQVPKDFKSLLPPKFIRLLEHKLKTGEMTSEECKTVLKEFMLREYDRKQAEQSTIDWKALVTKLKNRSKSFFKKLLDRPPTESSISMEELTGTVRARRI
jgi:hypothetical protein